MANGRSLFPDLCLELLSSKHKKSMSVLFLFFCFGFGYGLDLISYNIQHGANLTGFYNISKTGETIKNLISSGPFLVGIQEVDVNTTRTKQDQPAILANLTNSFPTFAKMRDFEGGAYGILVLSSTKPLETKVFRYQKPGATLTDPQLCKVAKEGDFCQGAVAVKVVVDGTQLWFATTHIGLNGVQENEANQLLEFLGSLDAPFFVTGDFNSLEASATIQLLREHLHDQFLRCGSGSPLTFNSGKPTEWIDYIFASKNNPLQCKKGVVVDTQTSDHRPVLISF